MPCLINDSLLSQFAGFALATGDSLSCFPDLVRCPGRQKPAVCSESGLHKSTVAQSLSTSASGTIVQPDRPGPPSHASSFPNPRSNELASFMRPPVIAAILSASRPPSIQWTDRLQGDHGRPLPPAHRGPTMSSRPARSQPPALTARYGSSPLRICPREAPVLLMRMKPTRYKTPAAHNLSTLSHSRHLFHLFYSSSSTSHRPSLTPLVVAFSTLNRSFPPRAGIEGPSVVAVLHHPPLILRS